MHAYDGQEFLRCFRSLFSLHFSQHVCDGDSPIKRCSHLWMGEMFDESYSSRLNYNNQFSVTHAALWGDTMFLLSNIYEI